MHYYNPMLQPVQIRFYNTLNDFLPSVKRHTQFEYNIRKPRSVKDLIESIGIPHTEVDIILVDRQSVDFQFRIEGGEDIRVYAYDHNLEFSELIHNQPKPANEPRFVLDVHLGQLANYLRMLGFDTLYRNDYDDPTLASIADTEQRILVTRDRRLLMRRQITLGYFVRARLPKQQISELLTRFDLLDFETKVARCISCNGIIQRVEKAEIEAQLLPLTRQHYDDFFQCQSCKKIYWEGSHFEQMQELITDFRSRRSLNENS